MIGEQLRSSRGLQASYPFILHPEADIRFVRFHRNHWMPGIYIQRTRLSFSLSVIGDLAFGKERLPKCSISWVVIFLKKS